MDREYEYVFVGNPDHYGFLSHDTGKCSDPLFKKGIGKFQGPRIFNWQTAKAGSEMALPFFRHIYIDR